MMLCTTRSRLEIYPWQFFLYIHMYVHDTDCLNYVTVNHLRSTCAWGGTAASKFADKRVMPR